MTNKTDTSVVGLIKEKREKAQINNEKRELMRESFFFQHKKQLCTNKLENEDSVGKQLQNKTDPNGLKEWK